MSEKARNKYIIKMNSDGTWTAVSVNKKYEVASHVAYPSKDAAVATTFQKDPDAAIEILPFVPDVDTSREEAHVKALEADLARARQALADTLAHAELLKKVKAL